MNTQSFRASVLKYVKRTIIVLLIITIVVVGLMVIPPLIKTQNDTTAVVQQIRALNKWETASFTIEKVIDQGNSGNMFQQFLFGDKILLIARGEAVAGFDLTSLSPNDVHIQGNSITVTLPKPQIIYTRLDNDKTRVYDRQQGLLTQPDKDLESNARASAEKSIQATACSDNILTVASDNARKELSSLLAAFKFTTITISIPQGSC